MKTANKTIGSLHGSRAIAEKRAAKEAEKVAELLHSFAGTLTKLSASGSSDGPNAPTPRNWWKIQSGRFKDDATFPAFVAQIQAARRREG